MSSAKRMTIRVLDFDGARVIKGDGGGYELRVGDWDAGIVATVHLPKMSRQRAAEIADSLSTALYKLQFWSSLPKKP